MQLTPLAGSTLRVKVRLMGVSKLQVGTAVKKDGTKDIYLVTRLFSEALSTMVILRKSGRRAKRKSAFAWSARDGGAIAFRDFRPRRKTKSSSVPSSAH